MVLKPHVSVLPNMQNAESVVDEQQVSLPSELVGARLSMWYFFQIPNEEVKLHLEDCDSLQDQLELLLDSCMGDFPDDDKSEVAAYAATITDQTRNGHTRCVPGLPFCCYLYSRAITGSSRHTSPST
jgi:hypothetical protein